jgi:ATP-dependent DNA helicase RecG
MNLQELLTRPGGKTLELKRDLTSPNGVVKTIVAFANTAGGILLIGVDDPTRTVRGVVEPLQAEERLASLISDSIQPRLLPDIEILPWRNTHLLAVQVFPSETRPVIQKDSPRRTRRTRRSRTPFTGMNDTLQTVPVLALLCSRPL